ncbi:hypothetical protein RI054_01g04470 [Pseudoscourfieldia marina]
MTKAARGIRTTLSRCSTRIQEPRRKPRRRLALPVQGRGGGRNGGRTGGEEAATPNVSTRGDTTDSAKTQTVQLHTLTTLRCVMRLAARVTTQHVGAATPTQAAEVAVDEADIKVARRTRRTTPAADTLPATLHATATPKLPTTWRCVHNVPGIPDPSGRRITSRHWRHAAISSATTTVAIAAHA